MRLALALITLVIFMLGLAGMRHVEPGLVTLTYGDYTLETPGTVAGLVVLLALLMAYFLGELISWVKALPGRISRYVSGKSQQTTLGMLAETLAAQQVGETKHANKLLAKSKPQGAELALHTLLRLNGHMGVRELEGMVGNPVFGAPASLALARLAATTGDWDKVKDATTTGLALAPESPRLITLHLKALVNLGENTAAQTMLPTIEKLVSKPTQPLLRAALDAGGVAPKNLDHPWFAAFRQWLGTTSEILPEASVYVPGKKTTDA